MKLFADRHLRYVACIALLAFAFSGCSSRKKEAGGPAPEQFKVRLDTSKGEVVLLVRRQWAPKGVDHFHDLVKMGFYNGNRFFRVVPGFVVQFGINGDSDVTKSWRTITLNDDPVKTSNRRGTVTFATSGPNTRTTQLFINLVNNSRLDETGFAPLAEVVQGMDVVDRLYNGYGEGAPNGQGPDQKYIEDLGNAYLEHRFPKLDYIKRARVE